ncbi:hypothetical protein V6N11_000570 [Hibiscus sabdariffa]|uniref:Uncharacterized protein n=1 Tax=Hibiscus sabdariffa TaxID=183260 RepID=A0ABR2NTA7_9ROSI
MEMINLKPAYARKLNQQGLSHIHLAVEKRHKEMVLRLLEIDNDVVRVKGKNGYGFRKYNAGVLALHKAVSHP